MLLKTLYTTNGFLDLYPFLTYNNNPSIKNDSNQTVTMAAAIIPGCIDNTALNYNPSATVTDNTCVFAPSIITNDSTVGAITVSMNTGSAYDFSSTGTHKLKYFMDSDSTTLRTALSKVFTATTTREDSTITVKILNNNDSLYLYVRQLSFIKNGCTQPTANNYNQFAKFMRTCSNRGSQ